MATSEFALGGPIMTDTSRELELTNEANEVLAEALTVEDIKKLREKMERATAYAKQRSLTDNIISNALSLQLRAVRNLGEQLAQIELATGAPGNQYTGVLPLDRSQGATGPPTRLRDLGITKSESSRAQQIAALPQPEFDRYLEQCSQSGQEPTIAGVLRHAKQYQAAQTDSIPGPSSPRAVSSLQQLIDQGRTFSTIYSDPPWNYDNRASRAAAANHYPTMTLEQICAEPVAELAAEQAHLHLWTTNAFLRDAFDVIDAWKFTYKGMFVWVKGQLGVGNYWRCGHECMLLGVRGNLTFREHSHRSWIEADRTQHSRKPEAVRELIQKVSPPLFLEMYGRRIPDDPAWTVYGNQIEQEP